jgi:hypothetical protein
MGFFRKLRRAWKRFFCDHQGQIEYVLRSRRYQAIHEVPVDLWQDYLLGVECRNCEFWVVISPIRCISNHPYSGEPHYYPIAF